MAFACSDEAEYCRNGFISVKSASDYIRNSPHGTFKIALITKPDFCSQCDFLRNTAACYRFYAKFRCTSEPFFCTVNSRFNKLQIGNTVLECFCGCSGNRTACRQGQRVVVRNTAHCKSVLNGCIHIARIKQSYDTCFHAAAIGYSLVHAQPVLFFLNFFASEPGDCYFRCRTRTL